MYLLAANELFNESTLLQELKCFQTHNIMFCKINRQLSCSEITFPLSDTYFSMKGRKIGNKTTASFINVLIRTNLLFKG